VHEVAGPTGARGSCTKPDFLAPPLHFSTSHRVLRDFTYEAILSKDVWLVGEAPSKVVGELLPNVA